MISLVYYLFVRMSRAIIVWKRAYRSPLALDHLLARRRRARGQRRLAIEQIGSARRASVVLKGPRTRWRRRTEPGVDWVVHAIVRIRRGRRRRRGKSRMSVDRLAQGTRAARGILARHLGCPRRRARRWQQRGTQLERASSTWSRRPWEAAHAAKGGTAHRLPRISSHHPPAL